MKLFCLLALSLIATAAQACTEYSGYVQEHLPTGDTYISGTILGFTNDGKYTYFTLFGYSPGQPKKGNVSTDFVVRDSLIDVRHLDKSACTFVIAFTPDPTVQGVFIP